MRGHECSNFFGVRISGISRLVSSLWCVGVGIFYVGVKVLFRGISVGEIILKIILLTSDFFRKIKGLRWVKNIFLTKSC